MLCHDPLLARILIVDDAIENVRILARILERAGYRDTTGMTDPRSVVESVRTVAPALVILDLHMPHTDGFAVMDAVRSMVDDVPRFLVVTGDSDGAARSRALAAGADDVLTKPFNVADVLARVRSLLDPAADPAGERRRRA